MVLLELDPFLTELSKLFERTKASGTVFLTMKRTNMKPRSSKQPSQEEDYKCLVRATVGKRTISTVVSGREHAKFQQSYTTILKARMDGLKKREKQKKAASKTSSSKQMQVS